MQQPGADVLDLLAKNASSLPDDRLTAEETSVCRCCDVVLGCGICTTAACWNRVRNGTPTNGRDRGLNDPVAVVPTETAGTEAISRRRHMASLGHTRQVRV